MGRLYPSKDGTYRKGRPSLADPIRSQAERLWRWYPFHLHEIYELGDFDPSDWVDVSFHVFETHNMMDEYLGFLAKNNGVDGRAIFDAAYLCRHLFTSDFTRYYNPSQMPFPVWPHCLGDEYWKLPGYQRHIIDEGEKAFIELRAKRSPADSTLETVDEKARLAEQTDPISRAIALMLAADSEGKSLKKLDLPNIVGCSRSTLYRDPHFNATVKALKAKNRANIPRGSKTKDGNLEAAYDPDEE